MRRFVLPVFILALFSATAFAQKKASGKVVDANNNAPLEGATISLSGAGGTTTDKEGRFAFDCSQSTIVTVSYVGYETYKVNIKDCDAPLNIALVQISHSLNDVEITATSNPNKSLLYQPASITKLSSTELKRGTGLFLDDAINGNIPGVTMQRRAVASGQQFNIRGYGNGVRGTNGISSNFDGQGSKVYLNGIPITDAEGITLMDDIDFGSVGNVEVTKGPSGTLYGLAIAGVVNLKTIKPEKGTTSIGQDVLIGSYGLQRFTTHFQMAGERSALLINYGKQKTDGYMVHTKSQKDFVNIAGDFQPNEKEAINVYAGYSKSYDERGGELTIAQYNSFDYSGNPAYIKNNAHSEIISFRGGVNHTYNFNKTVANTTTVFANGVSNNASSAGGWTDKAPINYGLRSTFDTKFNLQKGINLSGITGIETQRQYAQITGYPMVVNPSDPNGYNIIGTLRSNQAIVTGTSSLFTEWTLALPKALSFTAGLGVSNMKIELNDRFYVAGSTKPTQYKTTYNGLVSPHFAINKVFSEKVSAYVSYSKGYKAPVSSYFFIPFTGQLNTGLKSEIGDQFEIGTKGALLKNKLVYEVALFDAKFKNKMTTIAVASTTAPNTTAYSYLANGGNLNNKGLEVLVKYMAYQSAAGFVKTIRPFGSLAYSDFKYEDYRFQKSVLVTEDYSGKAVAGVAKFVGNLGIDITTKPGLYANMNYLYKDGMPISSDGLNKTTSYSLLNAKLGFQKSWCSHFDTDVFFGVNNITGTQYAYMVFVNQLPDAYLPAPYKANYFGGVNLKYNF
jgi:iron complex outermembrane receptor protein